MHQNAIKHKKKNNKKQTYNKINTKSITFKNIAPNPRKHRKHRPDLATYPVMNIDGGSVTGASARHLSHPTCLTISTLVVGVISPEILGCFC